MLTLSVCYGPASLFTSCFLIIRISFHCHHRRKSSLCYG